MLLDIFVNITLPVFLLIGAGMLADRAFKLDLSTLSRLSFNVLLPALVFIKTLDANLSPAVFGGLALVNFAHMLLLLALSWAFFSLGNLKVHRPVATLAVVLPNVGNYGIPLAALAYGAVGANVMAIIVMLQMVFTITAGIWIVDSGRSNLREIALNFLKIPLLWAMLLALVMLWLHIQVSAFIRTPTEYLANGLVPVALVTLGAQLARSQALGNPRLLSMVMAFRLLLAPLLALGLVAAWQALGGADLGVAGPVMVIGAGMPVAVNVFILAAEYHQDTRLASQAIFWTTLISVATLTGLLAIIRMLY